MIAERTPRVVMAGNPNTGKTTLFNQLTGSRAKVGNYPGITVERLEAKLTLAGAGTVELTDLPGTYSLSARSEEEQVAIGALAGLPPFRAPDMVVAVVDSTQLTRNLYLVLQLIELDLPVVVALNMHDALEGEGLAVDAAALAEELGVPVVATAAARGEGIEELRAAIDQVLADRRRGRGDWAWAPAEEELRADVAAVSERLPAEWDGSDERRARALSLWALLSVDDEDELAGIPSSLRDCVRERHEGARRAGREIDRPIIAGRYAWIDERAERFVKEAPRAKERWTDRVDRVLLSPLLGFPIFLVLMTLVFQSLFTWADPMIGWIEELFGWVGEKVGAVLPEGLFASFVTDGLIGGVGSVLVFLPQILLLFLFIGLMEDTGYMARVAALMDRLMKAIGLHGRAFVPMLSGYACAIPAIMATRTMERRRDRMLTMMVVPLMTCSARLPVYGLLIAALYPVGEENSMAQGLLMVAMYLFSTGVALACAAVLGRTLFKGPKVPLILEMPPYRRPHAASVLRQMWQRSQLFIKEAGTVILFCTVGMWALLSFPQEPELSRDYGSERAQLEASLQGDELEEALAALDGDEAGERLRQSFGGRLGRLIEPTIEPLGFDWKIGIGLVGAFSAREVFVSTMAVVYDLDEGEDETSLALRERVRAQERPDGSRTYTPLVCFSLMVFFALACQCMSTLAVLKRETGGYLWPTFAFCYMTALAWLASLVVYQGGKLLGFE